MVRKTEKDIVSIMAAHGALMLHKLLQINGKIWLKIQRGFDTNGPVFINAMSVCTTEWKFAPNQTIEVSDLAVDSLVFPLYEIIDGRELNITYRPKNIIPSKRLFRYKPRFKHLFKPENEYLIDEWQKELMEDGHSYKKEKKLECNFFCLL